MDQLITTYLDTDLYKLNMQQVMLHQFPRTQAVYRFKCRNIPSIPLAQFKKEVDTQLDLLCSLRFSSEEIDWLHDGPLTYLKPDYIDFLEGFFLRRRQITTTANADGTLDIVAKGTMVYCMMFEIHVMSIVQELYMRRMGFSKADAMKKLVAKTVWLKEKLATMNKKHSFDLFDFGTRRRASRSWHEEVVSYLKYSLPGVMKGTSNVDLARRHNMVAIGTQAHEYMQAHQQLGYRLEDFQKAALENWVTEYRGNLGIALTDTITMDAFLKAFRDPFFTKLFDGMRHDSGCPYVWGNKFLKHYNEDMKIDANTKRMVFSNGLNFEYSVALYDTFGDDAMQGYGIGTWLTNDGNVTPLNLVMKMSECNGQPVAKISDDPGKSICEDKVFLAYLKQVHNVQD